MDMEIVDMLRRVQEKKEVFYLVNKVDSPEQEPSLLPPFYELGVDRLLPLSAEHRYGYQNLLQQLEAVLPPSAEAAGLTTDTIRMAFLGRPNVGKSSLINRIMGEDRMVVSELDWYHTAILWTLY